MFGKRLKRSVSTLSSTGEIQGNIYMDGDLCIDGIVHGMVEVHGTLEITASGLVEGSEIKCEKIIVDGILKADRIIAEGLIYISRTGKVEGQIIAGAISIENGATVCASLEANQPKVPQGLNLIQGSTPLEEFKSPDSLVGSGAKKEAMTPIFMDQAQPMPLDASLIKPITRVWNQG